MNRRGRLLLRGMRWRLGASLLTVLAATIAIATAVLGPLYLHAAGDSVVRRGVAAGSEQATGLTLPLASASADSARRVEQAVGDVASVDGRHRFYGAPIETVEDQSDAQAPGQGGGYTFAIIARTSICAHIRLVAGRCALATGDAVLSERSARRLGVGIGSTLVTSARSGYDGGTPVSEPVRVIGLYAIPNVMAAYWWDTGAGEFPFGTRSSSRGSPQLDPLFVSPATALSLPGRRLLAQVPLRPGTVDLATEPAIRRVQARILSDARGLGIVGSSSLDAILADADHQRHEMATIVAVAAVQLVLLAIWVLAALLVRSAEARQSEARVARLRGLPTASLLWATAAEPGLLCLLGAVLGIAVAWVTVVLARTSLLTGDSSIHFDVWAIVALVVTLLAIVGALGTSAVRLLRSTQLAHGAAKQGRGLAIGRIVDVVLVLLAVAALVALASTGALSGHSNPLAAAAPGLIALGVAVVAVQGILLACRLGVTRTGDSPRLAAFLALRQTARRPGLLRQARVLVIALGLACFATAAWSVARSNRASAAAFQVGADTVVTVAQRNPTALVSDVDAMDPHGRYAMAAVSVLGSSSSLLAVDAPRLGAVASWPHGISAESLTQIARRLDPPAPGPVTVPQQGVRVSATVSATAAARARLSAVDLDLWVANPTTGTTIVPLGPLRAGRSTYPSPTGTGGLSSACPGGCQLVGLGLVPPSGHRPPSHGTVTVAVSGIATSTGASVAADLAAGDWGASAASAAADDGSDSPDVHIAVSGGVLTLAASAAAVASEEGASGEISPPLATVADHPATLPTAATSELETANASVSTGVVPTSGLDGESINVHPVATTTTLPRLGDNATLVDLPLLARIQTGPTAAGAASEVWLGAHAPADVLSRLRAHGLEPISVQRASTVLSAMQRTGLALADDFLLVAAGAALLVAAASTLSALGATTRERATELMSLRVAGVPRRTLTGALALESIVLLLTALCGVVAGVLAAALALPSLPERATVSLVPLTYSLPVLAIAFVTVAVLAAVALAASGVATTLVQRMSPTLLRTAPDDISA